MNMAVDLDLSIRIYPKNKKKKYSKRKYKKYLNYMLNTGFLEPYIRDDVFEEYADPLPELIFDATRAHHVNGDLFEGKDTYIENINGERC